MRQETNETPDVLGPISELWNNAFDELEKDKATAHLITRYERELAKYMTAKGVQNEEPHRLAQMEVIARIKLAELEEGTWKVNFAHRQFAVRDLMVPVLGIIEWCKEYVGKAVESSGSLPASVAWAGVCVLLPVSLISFTLRPL